MTFFTKHHFPIYVDEESITQLIKLPSLHRDPFDRLLICQAIQHNLTIITLDQEIINYPIVQILK